MVVAAALVLAVSYIAKTVFVVLMVSILLAFVLEPIVKGLERLRLPRAWGSLLAVLLLLGIAYVGSYFFYNRAVSFLEDLPKYSQNIRSTLSPVMQKTNQLRQVTKKVLPEEAGNKTAIPVTVTNSERGRTISQSVGAITEVALTLAFIPFLVYFMLSWQEHARRQTVQLFPPAARTTA
jgi:predicted PurR-regulated permease PerM